MNRIRVLLADDHTILRDGIRSLLEDQPDMQVVGEAEDGHTAIRMTCELEPDGCTPHSRACLGSALGRAGSRA